MDFSKNTDATSGQYEPYPMTNHDAHMPPVPPPGYDPYGYQPYAQPPTHPTTMPGPVRAAQIISWLFGGTGLALAILAAALGKYELCGMLVAGFLPAFFLALFAFAYSVNGNGLRVASIIFASIGILWGLSGMSQQMPPGLLGFAASLAIVILLAQGSAGAWFKRPQ
ncbi:hypothetical protein [Nocardia sp. NPDC050406]|uniref:hypothetical protein n=1 Tax=Nocardia sp. NPDC050406 TaxID=3364318 RepID=UPI00379CCEA7